MASAQDMTTIDVPTVLRDLLAEHRLHSRQAYYEVVEEALLFWLDCGGWLVHRHPVVDIVPPMSRAGVVVR